MRIEIADSPEDLARIAADILAIRLSDGATTLGLAGGTTPRAVYRELQHRAVDWAQVTCWLPDERWVAPGDPEANAHMVRRELLDHVPARFLAPDTTLDGPEVSAAAYERILDDELGGAPDVVLLGMGADGHTASLFPGTDALDEDRPGYVANWIPRLSTWRLTATAPLLSAARHLIILVAGPAKAPAMRHLLVDRSAYPIGAVVDAARDVTWLMDREAAGA